MKTAAERRQLAEELRALAIQTRIGTHVWPLKLANTLDEAADALDDLSPATPDAEALSAASRIAEAQRRARETKRPESIRPAIRSPKR